MYHQPIIQKYPIPDAEFFLCAFLISILSKISWGTFSRMNSSKKFLWNLRYSLTLSSGVIWSTEVQQSWPIWVELAFAWPEKVGLFLFAFTSSFRCSPLFNDLEAYCVGRGAIGLPRSILDGEDIVFSFWVLLVLSDVSGVSMTAPAGATATRMRTGQRTVALSRNALIR